MEDKYYLVEVTPGKLEMTTCLGDLFDVVVSALDRWRYGKTEEERHDYNAFYVTKSLSYSDVARSVDIRLLSLKMLRDETMFSLHSKSDDHFDEEQYIRSFIQEACNNVQ